MNHWLKIRASRLNDWFMEVKNANYGWYIRGYFKDEFDAYQGTKTTAVLKKPYWYWVTTNLPTSGAIISNGWSNTYAHYFNSQADAEDALSKITEKPAKN